MSHTIEKRACPACGSPLKFNEGASVVVCEYCKSTVILKAENDEEREKLYENCCIRFNCAKYKTDILNIMPYLKELGDYKDSRSLYEKCERRLQEFAAKEKKQRIKRISITVAVMLIIILLITVPICRNKVNHKIENIEISLINKYSVQEGSQYYVYLDYKIENETKTVIDLIKVTTYIYKNNNVLVGTVSSTFGGYGEYGLNLKVKNSVIQQTYLSEYKLSQSDSIFYELYFNDISEHRLEYKITYVEFGDGKTVAVS